MAGKYQRIGPTSTEPIPAKYQKGGWKVIRYTEHEGGEWLAMGPLTTPPSDAAAIMYWNGWIFDFVLKRNHPDVSPWRHKNDPV